MKRDIPVIGFIIGALTPVLGFFIVYLIFRNGDLSFENFIKATWPRNRDFAKLLTLSLLANLIPFVYCNFKRYDYISKGVFVATMLYVVLIVLLMFVW